MHTISNQTVMTQKDKLTMGPIDATVLIKRLLLGAGIALSLITLFLLGVKEPKPEWGKLWMLKPLLIVPLAGASGGAFTYFLDQFRRQGGWKKALAIIVSLIGYIVAVWLGIVLGLNGTLWN